MGCSKRWACPHSTPAMRCSRIVGRRPAGGRTRSIAMVGGVCPCRACAGAGHTATAPIAKPLHERLVAAQAATPDFCGPFAAHLRLDADRRHWLARQALHPCATPSTQRLRRDRAAAALRRAGTAGAAGRTALDRHEVRFSAPHRLLHVGGRPQRVYCLGEREVAGAFCCAGR